MSERKFCPYCGNKVNQGAKFCGGCGKSLTVKEETIHGKITRNESQERNKQPVEKASAVTKDQINESFNQAKDGAQKIVGNLKDTVTSDELKNKVDDSVSRLKNLSDKTKKIVMVVVVGLVLIGGWSWFSNKDYRQEMKNGDTYFNRGEYEEAQKYFKAAQDMKPGNKKALEMYDYTQDLSYVWTEINLGSFKQGAMKTYETIEEKAKNTNNKQVKKAYKEAGERIKGTVNYEVEERVGKKYKDAYSE